MNVHDPLDKTWEKHYFVLSKTHLTYGIPQEEPQEEDNEMQDDDEEVTGDSEEFGEEEEWCVGFSSLLRPLPSRLTRVLGQVPRKDRGRAEGSRARD